MHRLERSDLHNACFSKGLEGGREGGSEGGRDGEREGERKFFQRQRRQAERIVGVLEDTKSEMICSSSLALLSSFHRNRSTSPLSPISTSHLSFPSRVSHPQHISQYLVHPASVVEDKVVDASLNVQLQPLHDAVLAHLTGE